MNYQRLKRLFFIMALFQDELCCKGDDADKGKTGEKGDFDS
jgi:hypothetical protein